MNSSQPYVSRASEHDHELLSCYLDNQLSAVERSDLERRLAQEPALRATLAELRATTEALRTLAPLQPARSFTLGSTGLRHSQRSFNWILPFASGLAGLVMLLVASIQLLAVPPATAPAPMAAMASPPIATERTMAEAASEASALSSAETTESPDLQQPEMAAMASPPIATERTMAEAASEAPALLHAETTESPDLQQPEDVSSTNPGPTLLLIFGTLLIGFALGWLLLRRPR